MQLSQRSATRSFASARPSSVNVNRGSRIVRACRAQQGSSSAVGAVAAADQQVSKRILLSGLAAAATAASLVKPGYVTSTSLRSESSRRMDGVILSGLCTYTEDHMSSRSTQ
jgi:hypothetical protein